MNPSNASQGTTPQEAIALFEQLAGELEAERDSIRHGPDADTGYAKGLMHGLRRAAASARVAAAILKRGNGLPG